MNPNTFEMMLDASYRQCGLNADWCVSAWHLGPSKEPNVTSGDYYVLDEEDGTWCILRRWYLNEGFDDINNPGNDRIDEILVGANPEQILCWISENKEKLK